MTNRLNEDRNKLIVALDVESAGEARRLIDTLRGVVGMFKIGSQLFTAAGPALVREIVESGERVFLDLKFHDIPNTVAAAGVEATRLGVSIFNVHAAGGGEMMRRTKDAVSETVHRESLARPAVIAVTVLTSSNSDMLREIGLSGEVHDVVRNMASLAEASGLDGVVASPLELGIVRSAVQKKGFLVVTPGVRPAGSAHGDQKRVTTPREAVQAGADYLVVGRPILGAPDPARAAQTIIDEIESVTAKGIS